MGGPTLHLGTTSSGERFSLPQDAVTQTIAILARRGQGKTYLARGLAEEMGRTGAQFVVLDPVDHWWGLRSNAAGDAEGLPSTSSTASTATSPSRRPPAPSARRQ